MALLGVWLSLVEVVASLKANVRLAESPEYLQNKADDIQQEQLDMRTRGAFVLAR